ncbi:MAG: hypothetical protein OEW04_03400 [Nitrospirota bacterium]|nr:hypothetical protein [Nitrospirota bacterium]
MKLFEKTLLVVIMMLFLGCAAVLEEQPPQTGGKVAVCHKGEKTIYVDEAAVKAHLGHGDYLGTCR